MPVVGLSGHLYMYSENTVLVGHGEKLFFLEIVLDVLETLDKSGCVSVCLVEWCHAHEPGNWAWLEINTGARALDLNMLSCKLTAGLGTMRTKLQSSTHCIDSIFFQGAVNVQNRS